MFHKAVQLALLFLIIVVIIVVFYFSWLPDPSFINENYLPKCIINWSNQNYNLRTAVPFLAVGFLLEAYGDDKNSNKAYNTKKINIIQNIVISAIIVCIAEGGQFLIHKRSPDFSDVFYGISGSIIGSLSYYVLKKLKNAKQT